LISCTHFPAPGGCGHSMAYVIVPLDTGGEMRVDLPTDLQ
jgi:hypothetical protein